MNPRSNTSVAATRGFRSQAIYSALKRHAGLLVDVDRWRSSETLGGKLSALSWPRLSVAVGAMALMIGGGVWMTLQSDGIRAHPPKLPTQQEWQATQAEGAFEGELSPALANANQSIPMAAR